MDLGLQGKVFAVAASSKGLGRATAMCLAREGALVTINGRDAERLAVTARTIRAETGGDVIEVVNDLSDPDAATDLIAETVRQRGRLDGVICNAGGPPPGNFAAFPDDQPWLDAINLNLMSTLRLSRAAIPHLEAQGGGSITNIVSISVKQPIPHLVLSNTARTAVIGLARSLALEVAGKNIRVNSICPGSILTDRIRSISEQEAEKTGEDVQSIIEREAAAIPMGRHGNPEEFGRVVTFFASPAASYVTGTTVQVDGGTYKGLL
ncbi:MAG TPA: SDR family oxidoreductase [Thermomicrobiales bacterium]|nr:SDR family oxidoreductase [Thermomicrobiales bacterium]